MKMNEMSKIFAYNGTDVTMRMQNGQVFINLTEVAKAFPEKNLSTIIHSQEITDYIYRLSEIKNFSSTDLLIVTRGGDTKTQGTWAHQKVALRVAQKLSTDFSIWVDTKIEELLTTGNASLQAPKTFAQALRLAADQQERIESQQKQITCLTAENETLKVKQTYLDIILQCGGTVCTTQIAQDYGLSARRLNTMLWDLNVQRKVNGQWILYSKFLDKGYVQSKTVHFTHSDGRPDVTLNTEWTQKGRLFLYERLKKAGVLPLIERRAANG